MAVDERDWDFETKLLRGTDALHQLDGDEQGREFDSGESDDECQPSRFFFIFFLFLQSKLKRGLYCS